MVKLPVDFVPLTLSDDYFRIPEAASMERSPFDMTIAELQSEIEVLQTILFQKVAGDPRQRVTVSTEPS